jgi:FixJ family two-component response regulator
MGGAAAMEPLLERSEELARVEPALADARAGRATGARQRRIVLTGLDSLTASERRVAEPPSQDLTNRGIAQPLFITPRTSKATS